MSCPPERASDTAAAPDAPDAADAPETAAGTTMLELTLRGGFVHVMSQKEGSLQSGPMINTAAPHSVHITKGGATDMTVEGLKELAEGTYSLDNLVVRLKADLVSDDSQQATGLPRLLAADDALRGAPNTEAEWNNRRHVPDIAALAQEATGEAHRLRTDWRDLLTGRVILAGGTLRFARPQEAGAASANWAFTVNHEQPGAKVIRTQHMTNEVIFLAKLKSPVAELVGPKGELITLRPSKPGGSISATIEALLDNNSIAAKEEQTGALTHFAHFYDLLRPLPALRPIPVVKLGDNTGFIFDGYCTDMMVFEQ
jgi:hypothetical protein